MVELYAIAAFDERARGIIAWIRSTPMDAVTWQNVVTIDDYTGNYIRWVAAALAVAGAMILFRRRPDLKYRRRLSLEKFIQTQADVWPSIKPIVSFNPGKSNGAEWAPAETPFELLAKRGLEPTKDATENTGKYQAAVSKVLASQLTELWRGPAELNPHQAAIYALIVLRGNRMDKEYQDLVARLSSLYEREPRPGRFDEIIKDDRKVRQLIRRALGKRERDAATKKSAKKDGKAGKDQKENSATVETVVSGHAYVETAIIAALEWARERGGVLPTADFIWLRAVDRNLYYILNSVGRRAVHMEAAGAIAHYRAEKLVRRPLIKPYMNEAYFGVIEQLSNDGHLD